MAISAFSAREGGKGLSRAYLLHTSSINHWVAAVNAGRDPANDARAGSRLAEIKRAERLEEERRRLEAERKLQEARRAQKRLAHQGRIDVGLDEESGIAESVKNAVRGEDTVQNNDEADNWLRVAAVWEASGLRASAFARPHAPVRIPRIDFVML